MGFKDIVSAWWFGVVTLLCGRHRRHEKLGVVIRYLVILYALTILAFVLLVVFRYTCDSDTNVDNTATTCAGDAAYVNVSVQVVSKSTNTTTTKVKVQVVTDTLATVTQVLWALSPVCATLSVCCGPLRHRYAPVHIPNVKDKIPPPILPARSSSNADGHLEQAVQPSSASAASGTTSSSSSSASKSSKPLWKRMMSRLNRSSAEAENDDEEIDDDNLATVEWSLRLHTFYHLALNHDTIVRVLPPWILDPAFPSASAYHPPHRPSTSNLPSASLYHATLPVAANAAINSGSPQTMMLALPMPSSSASSTPIATPVVAPVGATPSNASAILPSSSSTSASASASSSAHALAPPCLPSTPSPSSTSFPSSPTIASSSIATASTTAYSTALPTFLAARPPLVEGPSRPLSASGDKENQDSTIKSASARRPPLVVPRFPYHRHYIGFYYPHHYTYLISTWIRVAFVLPCFAAFTQYIVSIMFQACGWTSSLFLTRIHSGFNVSTANTKENTKLTGLAFLYTFFFGILWDLFPPVSDDWGTGMGFQGASWILLSLMEECGWMGTLFPSLLNYTSGDTIRSSIWCGLIWASWHTIAITFNWAGLIPSGTGYFVGLQKDQSETPLSYGLPMFYSCMVAVRIITIQFCVSSGTMWLAVIFHATHNVFAYSFFAQLPSYKNALSLYMNAESGFVLNIIYWIVAIGILKQWHLSFKPFQHSQPLPSPPLQHHKQQQQQLELQPQRLEPPHQEQQLQQVEDEQPQLKWMYVTHYE